MAFHKKNFHTPRPGAAFILQKILEEGESLSTLTKAPWVHHMEDKSLLLQLCYGTLRHYFELESILHQLMEKPLREKDKILEYLLLVGLYQLRYLNIPFHAAVTETVNGAVALQKPWAKGLVNGILRNYLRQQITLTPDADETIRWNHPAWLIQEIQTAWPSHWESILSAHQKQGPFTLRVNERKISRAAYMELLSKENKNAHAHPWIQSALTLEVPCAVELLPGFKEGWVSVQDGAAQLAGFLLPLEKDGKSQANSPPARSSQGASPYRVLDACAAPGGKACHLLERYPDLILTALDVSESRQERTKENLTRLGLNAHLVMGDALNPSAWWDGEIFDAILLDAPCSATGVIRRHPDIPFLRRKEDIPALAATQNLLLEALWPLLKPKGSLLYATCSILPMENDQVVQGFISSHPEALVQPLSLPQGEKTNLGWQCLPGEGDMDGFYYALLQKKEEKH